MAQKIIDDVTNLSTPKKMMTAIDENFTELYNDVAVNNNKVGVIDQISNLVEDTTPQLGGDLDLNGHTIQGMTTGGLGAVVEDTSPQLGGDLDLNGHTILNLPASGISEVVEDATPQLGGALDTNGNNIDNVTPAELNRVHGVTSPIQSQIDSKIGNLVEDTSPQLGGDLDLNGHTITGLSTGGLGSVAEDTTPQLGGNLDTNGHNIDNVTPTELNHIHGTTSSIQGQIDSKIEKVEDDTAPKLGGSLDLNGHSIIGLPSSNGIMEVADDPTPQLGGDLDLNGHNIIGLPSSNGIMNVVEDVTPQLGGNLDTNGKSIDSVTPTELSYVHGTTSNIQTQLDSKIGNLVEDTSPQLGGDLDLNNHTIIGLTTGGLGAVVEDTTPKLGGTLDTNGKNIDTVTPAELNRVHGVTSPLQSQIDSKISELKDDVSPQLGGDLDLNGHSILSLPVPNHNALGNLNAGDYQHLTAAQKSGLTGSIVTTLHKHDIKEDTTPQLGGDLDTNGKSIDNVTPTELNHIHGTTSNIQTQLDSKISSISEDITPTLGGNLNLNGNSIGNVTATEFACIHGITSAIQTQIDAKIASLVEDTNPKLGGDLDLNGYTIPGLSGSGGSTTDPYASANNIVTNFLMMNANSLSKQKIVNGFVDEFEDETGLDAASSYAYTTPYCHTDPSSSGGDLSTATYDTSLTWTALTGLCFSPDGTKVFYVNTASHYLCGYNLNTPWDITSYGTSLGTFDTSSQVTYPTGIAVSSDGKYLYTLYSSQKVLQYDLATNWQVDSASYQNRYESITDNYTDLQFNSDGSKIFLLRDNNYLYQYDLSTPWFVGTMGAAVKSLKLSNQVSLANGFNFSSDGTILFVAGHTNKCLYQYTLSTPWDIGTATYTGSSFSTSSYGSNLQKVCISGDGASLYFSDFTGEKWYRVHMDVAVSFTENQLLSIQTSSIETPETVSFYIWHEETDSIVLNTDLKGYVSREAPQEFDTDYISGNQILLTDHGYENNDRVFLFMESGSLPDGLTSDQVYYVVNATTNNFEVSLTYGGAPVSLSSDKSTGDTAYVLRVELATLTIKSQLNTGSLLSDTIDISNQKNETEMRYLITTHNEKLQKFHGAAISWS